MRMNQPSNKTPQHIIDKIQELHNDWLSLRKISQTIASDLWYIVSKTAVQRYVSLLWQSVHQKAWEIVNEIDEDLDTITYKDWYTVVWDDVLFTYKYNGVDFNVQIPIDVVDLIFADFSRKPWGGRLSALTISYCSTHTHLIGVTVHVTSTLLKSYILYVLVSVLKII